MINRIIILIFVTFLCQESFSQSAKAKRILQSNKLKVVVRDFDPTQPISLENKDQDRLNFVGELETALFVEGFEVISAMSAQEILSFNNPLYENTEQVEVKKYKETKSVYVITTSGTLRADTGCGGRVPASITGRIVDLLNDSKLVGTFNFSQGKLEGKCMSDVAEAIAIKLREVSVR